MFQTIPIFWHFWGNKQIIDYNIMYITTCYFTIFPSHTLVNKFPQYKRIVKHKTEILDKDKYSIYTTTTLHKQCLPPSPSALPGACYFSGLEIKNVRKFE